MLPKFPLPHSKFLIFLEKRDGDENVKSLIVVLDSPKRQCVRESEQQVKPDTPAIPSVRSRLQDLASQHAQWSEAGAGQYI